jgi:hypothetical protein
VDTGERRCYDSLRKQNHEPKEFLVYVEGLSLSIFGLSSRASADFGQELSALAFVIQFSMASLFFEVVGSCELSRVASHP